MTTKPTPIFILRSILSVALSATFLCGCAGVAKNEAAQILERGPAGTSDTGGGDWFVKPLLLKKILFADESLLIEGVRYQRIDLRRCSAEESRRSYPESEPVNYFPGRGFSAVKVQLSFNNILCSYGTVERDPEKALQILVNNDGTNRDRYFEQTLIESKVYGGPSVTGNFLMFANAPNEVRVFGNAGRVGFKMNQHFWQGPIGAASSSTASQVDSIYVPIQILPSETIYFGNNPMGLWRIVLPLVLDQRSLPLRDLAEKYTRSRERDEKETLGLMNTVALPKGFPGGGVESWTTVAQIWQELGRTSKNHSLMNQFFKTYQLPFVAGVAPTYSELKLIAQKFEFKLSPTVNLTDLNRAAFHKTGQRVTFSLPLLNPTWRVVADMIHEVTHAIQKDGTSNNDEQRFRNEMEAHLNERAYLTELAGRSQVIALAMRANNSIAAAGVPKLRFVDSENIPVDSSLCENVIRSYALSKSAISAPLLNRFGCVK